MRLVLALPFAILGCVGSAAAPLSPAELGKVAPLTAKATAALEKAVERLPEPARAETSEALFPDQGCIAYLKGLDAAGQERVLDSLLAEKYITSREAAAKSLFGYPHKGAGACPARLQSVRVAPGGDFNGHHAWPGGLAVHEATNLKIAEEYVADFRETTGEDKAFDLATVTAAVLWHDWAKTVQFQWNGPSFVNYESPIAGTGSHHIIGLAEAMARHMPPRFVVAEACAHGLPDDQGGKNVVAWLKAASIIARIDPVAGGYLKTGADGSLHADFPAECQVNFLSDQNWSSEGPALKNARVVLSALARDFGYAPSDGARFESYENTALAFYGADAIALLPKERVKALLAKLKAEGRI